MTVHALAERFSDPIHAVMLDAFEDVPHLKPSLLVDYMLGHLPSPVPAWSLPDLRRGFGARVATELRREIVFEDRSGNKQRMRVYVPINGYHKRFHYLTVDEYRHYVAALEQSSRYDRARIAFHKRQLAELEGGVGEIGDLLGLPL